MDRFLKPAVFDKDPNSPTASKEWTHWFRTFSNFLTAIEDHHPDKLNTLINYIDHNVYDYISECNNYDSVIEILKNLYVKPKNVVFARHLLATRKQKSGENIDEYLQALKELSKDCNFTAVDAAIYCNEAIKDSFINGLLSNLIRQRLLENAILDLESAFTQAHSLDLAQKSSESYSQQQHPINAAAQPDDQNKDSSLAATNNNKNKCYFCGNNRHPCRNCPAHNFCYLI